MQYERNWRQIWQTYYPTSPFPSEAEVGALLPRGPDRAFLSLYSLLWHRHSLLHLPRSSQPSTATYASSWAAYMEWFSIALEEGHGEWRLPVVWVYDILSEFVYQFEKQQQEKTRGVGRGGAGGEEGGADTTATPAPTSPSSPPTAWALADVLRMLHALVDKSGLAAPGAPPMAGDTRDFRAVSGYMASLCLVRMYGKLADYGSALEAARPLGLGNPDAPYVRVHTAHATVLVYASFSLIQSRRYEEALRLLSRSLRSLQQQCRVFDDNTSNSSDFLRKQALKMLYLTALAAAACPAVVLDEVVAREVKRRHSDLPEALAEVADVPWKVTLEFLGELDRSGGGAAATVAAAAAAAAAVGAGVGEGEEGGGKEGGEGSEESEEAKRRKEERLQREEDRGVLVAACVKLEKVFADASPSFFAYTPSSLDASPHSLKAASEALYNAQLRLFRQEVLSRVAGQGGLRLRSVMRMYTTIGLPKLAAATGLSLEDARSALTAVKLKAWASAVKEGGEGGGGNTSSTYGDPLHFYLDGDVVHVDEVRRSENVGTFFVNSIRAVQREMARGNAWVPRKNRGGDRD